MLGFKSFSTAANVLAGIQLMHIIRKDQFKIEGIACTSFADQFSALAGMVCLVKEVQCRSGEIPPFDQQRDRIKFPAYSFAV